MIDIRTHRSGDAPAIEDLVASVFTESDGEEEGARMDALVGELMAATAPDDLVGFVAVDGDEIIAAIFFSRMRFPEESAVFLLSPVAVRTAYQGRGVGQAVIARGLQEMKERGVRTVVTYGDPAFYAKVGFEPVSQDTIPPPLDLSQPEGWLARSLTQDPIEPLPGPSSCVEAFGDPAYW
jgi:predicted N-acetyltransferase YhbS